MLNHKRIIIPLFLIFVFTGCSAQKNDRKILVRVNNYEIGLDEFEKEFNDSVYSRYDSPEAKSDFLNILINRKLILQDAEKSGLNRDEEFLKMVERFYEQSLVKIAVEQKSKELSNEIELDDKEVKNRYDKLIEDGKTDKSYEEMYSQLKWEILQEKETKKMEDWIEGLRKNAKIKINQNLLDKAK